MQRRKRRGIKMNFNSTSMAGSVKYALREAMTPDELFVLMNERWDSKLPGKYQLKKGLFGTFIKFDTYLTIQPRVKIKNNIVKVTRMTVQTKTGGVDIKAASQAIKAVREGGVMGAALGGMEYFVGVCEELERVLRDKLAN